MRTINTVFLACLLVIVPCASIHAQWVQTNLPYSNTKIYALAANSSYLFAGTYSSGVYRSTDNGAHWTQLLNGLTSYNIYSLLANGSDLLAGTDAGVCLSTDNGSNWTSLGLSPRTMYSLASRAGTPFAGTESCVYTSSDNGSNWAPRYSLYTYDDALMSIGSKLYCGSQFNGVCASSDNGATWSESNTGLTTKTVFSLAVMPTGSGPTYLFAGVNAGGAFVSADSGASWAPIDSGLTNRHVLALAVSNNMLFCGIGGFSSNNNIYSSSDRGTLWAQASTGLLSVNFVYSFLAGDSNLYAGTDNGVWRRPLSQVVTGVPIALGGIPVAFRLDQNYPNPFNPGTVITFTLPSASRIRIAVFDLLGREVKLLFEGVKPAGYHELTFDGTGVASGVYLYRMETPAGTITRKMILLK